MVDPKRYKRCCNGIFKLFIFREAQRIAGDNFYRPSNPDILNEYADTFDLNINLVTIQDFGGWDEVQKKHFDDGGVFDRIYEKTDK